jgi:hypothetical protein
LPDDKVKISGNKEKLQIHLHYINNNAQQNRGDDKKSEV